MIDEEETFRRFGYRSIDLKPKSGKRIVAICDDCGKVREIQQSKYRSFCHSCAIKGERHPLYGKHHSEEAKEKMRKNRANIFGRNNPFWGKHHTKEAKNKIREKLKKRKFPQHHTKPELIFEEICKRNHLDFHYVGDGQLWIGKKGKKQLNPDFIEANGKKICVEVMGAYWHSPLLNQNIKLARTLDYRKNFYQKYKWTPIFIWDTDLLRKDAEQFVLYQLKEVV